MEKVDYRDNVEFLTEKREEISLRIQENKTKYIDFLIKESGLKQGEQYLYGKDKVWITCFLLNISDDLTVKLNKVKKNGENGMNTYGCWNIDINNLEILEG